MLISNLVTLQGCTTVGDLLLRGTVIGGAAGSLLNAGSEASKGAADFFKGTRSLTEVGRNVAQASVQGCMLGGMGGAAVAASIPINLGRGVVLGCLSTAGTLAVAPAALAVAAAVGGGYLISRLLSAR